MAPEKLHGKRLRVLIQYNVAQHYREPIFRLLCEQGDPAPHYSIYVGDKSNFPIKTIDPSVANEGEGPGTLRLTFMKNHWIHHQVLWQSGLIRYALSGRYDVLVALGSMYHISTWCASIIARLRGKKVLMWSHGFLRRERGLKGAVRRLFYRLAHGMLLYGHRARRLMGGYGFESDSLYVVYNSLDYEKATRIRETLGHDSLATMRCSLFADPELPVVVYIGRLTSQKRLDLLLEAARILDADGSPVNLLLIGGGECETVLREKAAEAGIEERVVFYGPCYDEVVLAKLLALSDVCVSPGEVGLTAIHSLTYGTPVITHDCFDRQGPEFEAITEGQTGAFFRSGDVKNLASTIAGWIGCKDRRRIGEACSRVVEQYYNPYTQVEIINAAVAGRPASEIDSIRKRASELEGN